MIDPNELLSPAEQAALAEAKRPRTWVPVDWAKAITQEPHEIAYRELREGENPFPKVRFEYDPARPTEMADTVLAACFRRGDWYSRGNRLVTLRRAAARTTAELQSDSPRFEIVELTGAALAERITQDCTILRRNRKEQLVEIAPPPALLDTIESRRGADAPPLVAIASAPFIDTTVRPSDGGHHRLVTAPGYDAKTGLFGAFDPSKFPRMRRYARHERARAQKDAARHREYVLTELFAGYEFRDDTDADAAAAFASTAVHRSSLATAPGFVVGANVMASGKTTMVLEVTTVAYGVAAALNSYPANAEEEQKIIGASLAAGKLALVFDNVPRGATLDRDTTARMVTAREIEARRLGESELMTLPNSTLLVFTGNNPNIAEDLTSRMVEVSLAPKTERPDQRRFDRDPIKWAAAHRGEAVHALLAITLAYLDAGEPDVGAKPSRFPDWDRLVRFPLMFAGGVDPATSFERSRRTDPSLALLGAVLHAWRPALGDEPITSHALVDRLTTGFGTETEALRRALHELIGDKARGQLTASRVGSHLKKHLEQRLDGLAIKSTYDGHLKVARWYVSAVTEGAR